MVIIMQKFLINIGLFTDGTYVLRILVAVVCGILIGYERESNMKTAGVPTHAVVALAASLMMLVSKYGFFDVIANPNISVDPSRIAASVVSAIGFLGAGVIFKIVRAHV